MDQSQTVKTQATMLDLLDTLNLQENTNLKACLAGDLTAWMYARALLKGSDARCSPSDIDNLFARFRLTAEMILPPRASDFAPPRNGQRGFSQLQRDLENELNTRGGRSPHPALRPEPGGAEQPAAHQG